MTDPTPKPELPVLLWSTRYGALDAEPCEDIDDAALSAWQGVHDNIAYPCGAEVFGPDGRRWVGHDELMGIGDRLADQARATDGVWVADVLVSPPPELAGKAAVRLKRCKTFAETECVRATYGTERVTVVPLPPEGQP